MKCPNCNRTYDDDFKFCPYCGEKKPEPKICPKCEIQPNIEFSFCPECGTELFEKTKFLIAKKYIERGIEFCESEDYENTKENFENAIENFKKGFEIVIPQKCLKKIYSLLNEISDWDEEIENFEEVLGFYEKFLKVDSSNDSCWFSKANSLYRLGRYEESIQCYDKTIELKPDCFACWRDKALPLWELGRYEEALECLDKSIYELVKLGRDPSVILGIKGDFLKGLGKYEEALECCNKEIELQPEYAFKYTNKAELLEKLERYEEALECYDKAIELEQENSGHWHIKGDCLYQLEKYEEALECYDKAIELDSNNFYYWVLKGNALFELGRYEEALLSYEKAKKQNSDIYISLKAEELMNNDQYGEAIKYFEKLIEIEPYCWTYYNMKGICLEELGKDDEAIEYFDKAASLYD